VVLLVCLRCRALLPLRLCICLRIVRVRWTLPGNCGLGIRSVVFVCTHGRRVGLFRDATWAAYFFVYVVSVVSEEAAGFSDHSDCYFVEHVFRDEVYAYFFLWV
jgi:hypothetical protein